MSDEEGSDSEMYSYTSRREVYKRSRSGSRTRVEGRDRDREPPPRILVSSDSDERSVGSEGYERVTKYAIDYNNRNYVRSQCNKNKGLHRQIKGRPEDWHIQYDNSYFTRSKVNAPRGYHRKIPDVKRKYVPDKDDLADATGWEFECGPEFDQTEQDVCYIPEGRIITRGCYRWHGAKRNDSDCDIKVEEHREKVLSDTLENQLRAGHEFLQSDVPHLREAKDRRYSKGGYRHYEVLRNAHDIHPEELAAAAHDPEWKRKHHSNGFRYLDLDMCQFDKDSVTSDHRYGRKGKPFRRTVLNKVHELRKVQDHRTPKRRGTRLSLVPGEGDTTFYKGVRDSDRASSARSLFSEKSERRKYAREGGSYEEYTEEKYSRSTLSPDYQHRAHRMADEKRGQKGRLSHADDSHGTGIYKGYTAYDARPVVEKGRSQGSDFERDHEQHRRESTNRRNSADVAYGEQWRESVRSSEEQNRRDSVRTGYDEPRRGSVRKAEEQNRRDSVRAGYDEPRRGSVRSSEEQNRRDSVRAGYDESRRASVRSSEEQNRRDSVRTGYDEPRRGSVRKAEEQNRRKSQAQNKKERMHPIDEFGEELMPEEGGRLRKMPPHVEERIEDLREEMANKKFPGERAIPVRRSSESDESIDLMKHKDHPEDRGESHRAEFQKHTTKNGSEEWVKSEEKMESIQHKGPR